MEEHYWETLTLQKVADEIGISVGYLSTQFSVCFKYGFIDCLNRIRVKHACSYLLQNYLKIYEIAFKVGYRDEKYFSRIFKKIMGISPSQYRKHSENNPPF